MATSSPFTIPLAIDCFSKEGWGQGNWQKSETQSIPVSVPFTMPGDRVEVHPMKTKHLYQGKLLQVQEPSAARATARCIHFGKCGGCLWQHLHAQQQLEIKQKYIKELMEPYASADTVWYPIVVCDPPWNYRNKMELTFSTDKYGKRYLGMILWGTRGHVFQLKECYLSNPWIAQTVEIVSQWWEKSGLESYHRFSDQGALRTLTLREGIRTGDRMVMLTVSGHPDYAISRTHLNSFVAALQQSIAPENNQQKLSIFLRIQQIAKGKQTQFYEMLLAGPDHIQEKMHIKNSMGSADPLLFRISPTAFFQPNTRQAEKLYTQAIALSDLRPDSVVYDLYCGIGTVGICIAKQVKEVIGIELSPEAVVDAKENSKLNQLENISIYAGDVGKVLAQWQAEKKNLPDVVIVDPPRAGLDLQAIGHILQLKAPTLTYISCNPKTQAGNLEYFLKEGYRLHAIQPVDQFPQTFHVENIVVLKR